MKEPYGEGVAHHTDPESWGGLRKGAAKALTGAHMGQVLSREIICSTGVLMVFCGPEGYIASRQNAQGGANPTRSETLCTCGNTPMEPGRPWSPPCYGCVERAGKPMGGSQ